jgi:FkbM family methyltransferase
MHYLQTVIRLFLLALKSRNPSAGDSLAIFTTLLGLHFKSKFSKSDQAIVSHKIAGFKIYAYDYYSLATLYMEIFLDQVYHFDATHAKPKIVDCGANIGMAILYFKKLYPQSEIWAYEANPVAFELLKRNVQENNIEGVQLFNYVLSSENGVVDFYVPDQKGSLNASLHQKIAGGERQLLPSYQLSGLLPGIGKEIDFMKIDIEGAEEDVIKDLYSSRYLTHVKHFIIEYHHIEDREKSNFRRFLAYFDKDFSFEPIGENYTADLPNLLRFRRNKI